MFKSFRSKLILFSLSLILAAVVPIVIATNILIDSYVRDTHMENVGQQVHTIEQMLGVFYDDLDRNIDMFANHAKVRSADSSLTHYLNYNGETRMTPSVNGGIEQELYGEFQNYGETHPGTLYIYMGTEDGGYVQWPETKNSKNYDPRQRPWYAAAMGQKGKVVRTAPYADGSNGEVIVSNIRTFKDKSGRIYGAMGIDVSSHKLATIMNGVKIGNTGYAMMLHRSGLILADPKNKENNLKYVKDIGIEKMASVLETDKASFETDINNTTFQVNSFKSANTDWIVAVLIEKQELSSVSRSIRTIVFGIAAAVLLCAGALAYVLSGRVIRPVNRMVAGLKDIARGEGDLTMRLECDTRDEIGEMAKWFNVFVEKLQGIISSIAGNSGALNASSTELQVISREVSQGANNISDKSNDVAAAAEEMSANMASVAAAVEQSSTNISMVSAAAEEMTSTIQEIAQNTEKTRMTSNQAVEKTRGAAKKIDYLSRSAQEIGNVVETITDISEQTNLLALNATIEAARAGEAGKGFAVVASEIKDLARQTAEATLEIKEKIEGIQGATRDAVSEIGDVTEGIASVNGMIDTVAAAVEEQSVTTQEIAANVSQAANGIQEVTENVSQSSGVADEIARDVADVNLSVNAMTESSSRIDTSAGGLSGLAGNLDLTVGQFKV